jgi:PKD repeat protein
MVIELKDINTYLKLPIMKKSILLLFALITYVGTYAQSTCTASFNTTNNDPSFTFTNTSQSSSNPTFAYWNFGDSNTSNSWDANHTYANNGTYLVTLQLFSNDSMCWSTEYDTVVVTNGNASSNCQAGFYAFQDSTNTSLVWVVNTSTSPNPPMTYFWDFGDGNNSTAAYPQHTYANYGSYLVCVTITDALGCSDMYCDSISVTQRSSGFSINVVDPAALGVEEVENINNVSDIYPNPATNNFNIDINLMEATNINVTVYDITGKVVNTGTHNLSQGTNQLNVSTGNMSNGMYTVVVTDNKTVITRKLFKR